MPMYLDHFGLAEPPFRITPHTDFFFSGGNRGATLDALFYAITHDEGIVKVSGEVGSGKTMLCRVLMERLPDTVTIIYLSNPSLSREDILYAVADELRLDVPDQTRAAVVLRMLQDHLIQSYVDGRQVVVLIDEAHAMPVETLEEIRLLSNLESNHSKLLQLVLFGQPELNDVLARPDMRQLKERITHNFALEPLIRDDIAGYLEFRLRAAGYKGPPLFSPAAIKSIARESLGLTRRINILADKALLAAFAGGTHQIGTREINAAIKDSDFSRATYLERSRFSDLPRPAVLAIGATIIVATILGAFLALRPADGDATRSAGTPAAAAVPAKSTAAERSVQPAAGESASSAAAAGTAVPAAPASNTTTAGAPAQGSLVVPAPQAVPDAQAPGKIADTPGADSKALGPLTRESLLAGREWLAASPDHRWFLQLYATGEDNHPMIETYLQAAKTAGAPMADIRTYRSSLSGSPRIGVVFGSFGSHQEARAAIRTLPGVVRASNPYPRQVVKLR